MTTAAGELAGYTPMPVLGPCRATTYVPPILIGIVTYLAWKRGLAVGIYAKGPDVRLSPGPVRG